jgi:thiol-disulfide isomerase/thioredoxin
MEGYQKNNFWGDLVVGASLGPIFSACSPTYFVILATVLPVSPALGITYLLTYTFGLCLALFILAILGQRLMNKLGVVSDSHGWFKRTLGIIFILVAVGILTGYDKKLQISILDAGFFDVTKVEQTLLDRNSQEVKPVAESATQADTTTNKQAEKPKEETKFLTATEKAGKFTLAPELSTIDGYINTDGKPITIGEFKGKKAVLLDIWTYSCINCQRTIPYLNDWQEKYADKGLEIIGLHTPEFSFERVLKNVQEAVKNFNIKYPVVLDNDFSTWQAYQNQYWPRKYLIDIDGYIVYDHAGEGDYDVTEKKIQEVLAERNARLGLDIDTKENIADPKDKVEVETNQIGSPETYFGSARNQYLANGQKGVNGTQNLLIPTDIEPNSLYLGGAWNFNDEYAASGVGAEAVFEYKAKNVYMVASGEGAVLEVYLDGKLDSTVKIQDEKLYPLVQGADYSAHVLKFKVKSGTLKAFTFTFG